MFSLKSTDTLKDTKSEQINSPLVVNLTRDGTLCRPPLATLLKTRDQRKGGVSGPSIPLSCLRPG